MDSVQVSMENLKVEGGTNNKEEEKRVSDSSEEEEVGIQNADGSVAVALPQEIEEGNIEYKLKLVNPTQDRIEHLISQMKWRLTEGMGEAIYEIGVEDDGNPTGLSEVEMAASIKNLEMMAKQLSADISVLRTRDAPCGKVAEVLVRRYLTEQFVEVRVAVVGNVDSGKSTMLGVLTRGQLDNGRGLARTNIFIHKHEIETGRTSSISQEILGFDSKGQIVNYAGVRNLSTNEICESSAKIVNFIDLAGHEKYLKTTVFGLTGHSPDFAMLMIGANMGVSGMTKEHLGIVLALRVPVFLVVTKIDMCPENILKETMQQIKKVLKSPGCKKIPILIRNDDDVIVAARNFVSERIAPIFTVSNVTGHNIDLLRKFLNLLPVRTEWEEAQKKPPEFHIDSTFSVPGVGTVVSGTLVAGNIAVNQTLMLGPDEFGNFNPAVVKSIQTKRLPVKTVKAGQTAAIALKKIKRSSLRKGMVMVDPVLKPVSCREFEAEVLVLYHSTTISANYQAVVHSGVAQQTAKLVGLNKDYMRTGDKAKVQFRFMYWPEYMKEGARLIFREGRTKGIGRVTRIIPHDEEIGDIPMLGKRARKKLEREGAIVPLEDRESLNSSTDDEIAPPVTPFSLSSSGGIDKRDHEKKKPTHAPVHVKEVKDGHKEKDHKDHKDGKESKKEKDKKDHAAQHKKDLARKQAHKKAT
eukprot:TRINITY_DN3079_c0_g1_i1.p1 TRINITY_DN3079_c0_g1~~TRINITY_DN3079_c0_g1_i1.p1  ORF type:complete len:693 (+),score=294.36 TRINITY_DN3079_c0_g1_i1:297-2375(+)